MPKIQGGGGPTSWILTPKCKKMWYSQKLSNLVFRAMVSIDDLYKKLHMVWLSDGEKNFDMFIRFDRTHE